jgi:hypothetical protein
MAPGSEAIVYLSSAPYGHPELRIPSMAIAPFSRDVLIPGPGAGTTGVHPRFHNRGHAEHRRITTIARTVGSCAPLLWVALAYAVGLTVVLNRLFLPKPTGPP